MWHVRCKGHNTPKNAQEYFSPNFVSKVRQNVEQEQLHLEWLCFCANVNEIAQSALTSGLE